MGAGVLPTCIHNGKLHFLFGKEHKYDDTPGFSDFGGGTDNKESFLKTAVREAGEELLGILGNDKEVTAMLKKNGTYNMDFDNGNFGIYRMHIFKMDYDEKLVRYFNNELCFLHKRLDPAIIKKTKLFEKAEIRWVCVDDLPKMRSQFRSYFQKFTDRICDEKEDIKRFIKKGSSGSKTRKNRD